ncbi:MAG: preprotein translocase subunit SecG [Wenzhouxiangellaceae bacterium]
MFTTLIVFQVLLAIGLIAIVLVQRGPGATMGAAFGAGASGTVFGSRGAGNFLTRTTGWMALGFFAISLTLAVLATSVSRQDADSSLIGSVLERPAAEQPEAGADPASTIDAVIDSLEQESGSSETAGPAESIEAAGADGETAEQAASGDDQPAEDDGTGATGNGG